MSYIVLARKFRPQTFEQVIDQAHITRTLANAISSGRVAHAILFSGPRGTGKTTVARILAKAMNCSHGPAPIPCNECRSCSEITAGHAVDVFEIDGASNNSVDQIRELRENVKYMPAHSPYKIYIIDEVHMLSMPAFNALLKTLEEPPAHVMFMFATTEPHKIPITILSRCQRHDFRRIKSDSIVTHMATICRRENFEITDESLGLIAREAGGSMRDALSLLDQILSCSQGTIAHDQVLDILGVVDRKMIFDLAGAILRVDVKMVLDCLDEIYDRGHDIKKLYADLLEHFRNLLVAAMGKKVEKLVDLPSGELEQLMAQAKQIAPAELNQIFDMLFREEASIRWSPQPKLALEVVFIRMLQARPPLSIDVLIDKLEALRKEMVDPRGPKKISDHSAPTPGIAGGIAYRSEPHQLQRTAEVGEGEDRLETKVIPSAEVESDNLKENWRRISQVISQQNPSLAANLSKCRLKKLAEDDLEIEVSGNDFTLKMIQRKKNMELLNQVCADIFGARKDIKFTIEDGLDSNHRKKKNHDNNLKQKALGHPLVADAIEIFNGTLVDVKIL